jgi:L-cysteine:1D-myo-inositol 2-amino-2-deoxy-alpha-D-glucopyranoside ligase
MIELAAERGGRPEDPFKDDPLDFVLWQPSAAGEPAWESLWGPGRPGWHIECSALAMRELGTTIDLHGGGSDLIFPHHECESAQSEAATGSRFVRHWMHVGMVGLGGEKMSKSLGNLVFVHQLLEQGHAPAAIRLALLAHNYRLGFEWEDSMLEQAENGLARWQSAGAGESALEVVRARIDDDLDTPGRSRPSTRKQKQGTGSARPPSCSASGCHGEAGQRPSRLTFSDDAARCCQHEEWFRWQPRSRSSCPTGRHALSRPARRSRVLPL